MENIFAIIFATLAGVSTALEAFINGELGKNTTALVATFISLVVGTIFFFINICVTGNLKTLASFDGINPKLLFGGILGGLVIYFTTKSVPNLGVSKTLTLIVVSQMIVGFLIDSHIYKETLYLYNYIGAILLFIGTFFILN
ncbi:MAG TPA: DMT family transporter [Romboutsia timonensis]|uniref:DMT family transporter n=1 Tax=Romboutsia timonensis TaxID=1776391 RepID=A0A921MYX9_9FIRM|nr:DMT family transporter [Romboutsia timonensis]